MASVAGWCRSLSGRRLTPCEGTRRRGQRRTNGNGRDATDATSWNALYHPTRLADLFVTVILDGNSGDTVVN
jgi:hypothetical protein